MSSAEWIYEYVFKFSRLRLAILKKKYRKHPAFLDRPRFIIEYKKFSGEWGYKNLLFPKVGNDEAFKYKKMPTDPVYAYLSAHVKPGVKLMGARILSSEAPSPKQPKLIMQLMLRVSDGNYTYPQYNYKKIMREVKRMIRDERNSQAPCGVFQGRTGEDNTLVVH